VNGLIVMFPTKTAMTSNPDLMGLQPKAILEHERKQEGRGADRHAEQRAAQIRSPEGGDAEDAQVDQG